MKRTGKIERFERHEQNRGGGVSWRCRFRVRAANGRILCTSEAYNSKRARDNGVDALKKAVLDAIETDLKEAKREGKR